MKSITWAIQRISPNNINISHNHVISVTRFCPVKHIRNGSLPYEYIYHLSNVMKHDFAFISSVVHHLLELDNPSVIPFKSNNCSTQNKSKYVFKQWQLLTAETMKSVIVYYRFSMTRANYMS